MNPKCNIAYGTKVESKKNSNVEKENGMSGRVAVSLGDERK